MQCLAAIYYQLMMGQRIIILYERGRPSSLAIVVHTNIGYLGRPVVLVRSSLRESCGFSLSVQHKEAP